ncbi:FTR1 family iron permease [Actinomyces lilanjuaniae]|uniref:FTR1 family iron permease n=1 Tax=Actinomyces lilanjuaniae TaxID=2321394 RepID=A0ABN5PQR2_9ACTO|nr:FTR1 family protein [Actinomyces lilanjuaniae]AYD90048.1 FTR1 family iron permease [Actinomyces lilanjuaniae]
MLSAPAARTGPVVAASLLLVVLVLSPVVFVAGALSPARASDSDTDHDTWGQAAAVVDERLHSALTKYEDGDTAGAASGFQSAYHSSYKASNMSAAVSETLGEDVAEDHREKFDALRTAAYSLGNDQVLSEGVAGLSQEVTEAATQLDATADLAGPRDYAQEQAAVIASQRAEIQASRTSVNEGRGDRTWTVVAQEMTELINQGVEEAQAGDGEAGAALVNDAYYGYYEKLGFEKTVMAAISGSRVSEVENQFKVVRKAMVAQDSTGDTGNIAEQARLLTTMLAEDAAALDGGAGEISPVRAFLSGSFGQAFLILLREGLEAILVVAAVIAYLVKAGMRNRVRYIYLGVALGLAASGVVALLFSVLFNSASAHQEVLEGVVALAAMVMLLFTSSWMLSKSSVESWNRYIKDRTEASVSQGGVWALASLSFLAVFREGAETVMFYQALLALDPGGSASVWQGFAAGAAALVAIFLLIRFTSVRIPLRPFFLVTSAMMAVLVVVFAGGGVHALLEGDVVPATYIEGWPTYDYLGVYPYVETLAAQAAMAVVVVGLALVSAVRRRRAAVEAQPESSRQEAEAVDRHGAYDSRDSETPQGAEAAEAAEAAQDVEEGTGTAQT